MSTLYEYHNTGADATYLIDNANDRGAQTFTTTGVYTISSVKLALLRVLTPGTITVTIRTVDGSSEPTVTVKATGTTDGDTLTTDVAGEWREITFAAAAELDAATEYAIVISVPGADAANKIGVRYDSSTGYAGGWMCLSSDAEANWDAGGGPFIALDILFENYGGGVFGAATVPVDKTYSRELVAICDNEVWREAVAGTMSKVAAASSDLDTTDVLNATVLSQKLFIVNGTIKKVLDLVNDKIATADVGTNPPDFGTILTGASGAKMIVDYITSATADAASVIYGKRTTTTTFVAGEAITGTNPSTSPYGAAVAFTMTAVAGVAAPHWYNYTVFGADATNYGTIPDKVYQICRYRGRIQLSGNPNYPHQWYQSRQLNPYDYLYVAGDAQSPVAGNNADCTEVGDIVKVAIPYSDDFLVFGCANELWVMSGDAAFGGELGPIDTTTGILGDRAWCWDDKVNLYMMGTAGLLRIPKGFGQVENLTRELYPDFVTDLAFNASTHRIVLAFNPEEFGIHIFKTTLATGACTGWWYDLRTEGLFPDAYPTAMGIYSAVYYQTENPTYKKLLVGCADGYIKSFDKATVNDDSTAITSYVGFVPLALSTHPRKDGIIKNIDIVTGIGDTDSDDVTCTVHVARTAGQVIKKLSDGDTAAMTKVFTAPDWTKSNLDRRSVRGQWGAIVLTNSVSTESWSMERLIVDSKEIGRSL